jgi:predicted NBD/HSP70 family sugar kinase
LTYEAKNLKIVKAKLGNAAGFIGAAMLVSRT